MSNPRVLIVGAGISGLSTAWWLAERGVEVEIWEAGEGPGGKIQTTREQGYTTERSASLIVNHRPQVDEMIRKAGLQPAIRRRPASLHRYLLHDNQLLRVPTQPHKLLTTPLWSWRGKWRLATEWLIPRQAQGNESAADFVRRRLGQEILDTAFAPFINGTLASDPEQTEAASVLPRLTELEQRYGSLTLGMFAHRLWKTKSRRAITADTFSFSGGMSRLITQLASTPGVRLRCRTRVNRITRHKEGWRIEAEQSGEHCSLIAEQLIISTPAGAGARLLEEIDPKLAHELRQICYAPISVAHLGFAEAQIAHPLDGSGFLVPPKTGLSLTGNLWMSSLFPQRAPNGKVLLSSYLGSAQRPEIMTWSDAQIADHIVTSLRPLIGLKGTPEYVRVDRHAEGLPLYYGSYRALQARIAQRAAGHPGLHLNGNYQQGVSIRERIYQGLETANRVINSLGSKPDSLTTSQPPFQSRWQTDQS